MRRIDALEPSGASFRRIVRAEKDKGRKMCLQCQYAPARAMASAVAIMPLDIVVLRRDHAQRGIVTRRDGSFLAVHWSDHTKSNIAAADVIRLGPSSFSVERRAVAR